MTKAKRSRRRYWIALLIYTVVISVAAAAALKTAWLYAEEYEASRVSKVIDSFVSELSDNLMSDEIRSVIASMDHPVQSNEEIQAEVKNLLSSGVTYQRKSSSNDGKTIKYSLMCKGKPFGSVSVEEDESKADKVKFGMLPWKVTGSSYDFSDLYHSVETVAPAKFKVLLNGTELGREYITEEGIHYDVLEDYYAEYGDLPTKVRYSYDKAIGDLEFTYKDAAGNDFVIDPNADDSQFVVECNDEQYARLLDFCTRFVDRYMRISCGLANIDALNGYVSVNSDLYSRLKLFAADGQGYSHTSSFRLDSAELIGAVELGGGYYLCEMNAHTTILYSGKGDNGVVENDNHFKIICYDRGEDLRVVSLDL